MYHNAENYGKGTLLCLFFRKIPVANNIMDKRGSGVSNSSVESILYHNAENFGKGTLLCCVSENFRHRRRLCIRGGRGYEDFPSKVFCLRVPKTLVVENICAVFRENSVGKKLYG